MKKYAVFAIAPESVGPAALGKKSMAVGTMAIVGPAAKTRNESIFALNYCSVVLTITHEHCQTYDSSHIYFISLTPWQVSVHELL